MISQVLDLTSADRVVYFGLVRAGGAERYTAVHEMGPRPRGLEQLEGRVCTAPRAVRPYRPTAAERKEFVRVRPGRAPAHELLRATHELRLLVYSGRMFAGCVSVQHDASDAVAGCIERRLRERTSWIVRQVRLAFERELLPPAEHAYALVDSRWRTSHATPQARRWLTDRRRAILRRLVSDGSLQERPQIFAVDHAALRVVPMRSRASGALLLELRPAEPLELAPDATLSPTQRRVAEYAASGATIAEIASALSRSSGTIQTHLREVYRRLGVSSRVELAKALGDASDRTAAA